MSRTLRYWNGQQWTDNLAPAMAESQAPPSASETDNSRLVTAGYALAILLPVVGFIIGIVLLTKPRGGAQGAGVMVVSVLAFYVFAQLIAGGYI